MNICLIRPSKLILQGSIGTGANTSSSYNPTAPLGIALIAATLRQAGHKITVIDAIAEAPDQLNELSTTINSNKLPATSRIITKGLSQSDVLARIPADTQLIGISCMFTHNWIADRELLNYLHKHLPAHIRFIAGGESITGMAETCLKQVERLTVCVLGEGEETVVDLVNTLENNGDIDAVKSIMYKKDGVIKKTERRTRIRNVDDVPWAAWDLFPVDNYEKHGTSWREEPRKSLPIMATRGCPYTCTFCTSPDMWGTRYYMRNPANVADEMEHLKREYNITNFEFYDLTAIIQKRWIMEFSQILIDRKMDVVWRIPSGTRTEMLDAEVARNLRLSGCYNLTYAPETGSPRLLELIHKKVIIPKMLQSMKQSNSEQLVVYINMILGLPDEKHVDVLKTLWFIVRCSWAGVNDISLGIFRPYPGSALFNRLVSEGKIDLNNDDFLVETILAIESEKSSYNTHIHPRWYRFYNFLFITTFYFSGYIFRPSRLVKAISNIAQNRHESRIERTVLYLLKRLKSTLQPQRVELG